jgi:hypothetical protein
MPGDGWAAGPIGAQNCGTWFELGREEMEGTQMDLKIEIMDGAQL